MADQTTSAFGGTKGASYILPWDTMMQYDQLVQQTKERYEMENQKKMETIASFEQQTQTGTPVYDRALEDHYEKLHVEMGKVVAKYRDPFSSPDGMKEMKTIQSKYLNNPIMVNAKQTEQAYAQLRSDYANNAITSQDYAIKKAEYDRFIEEGDATKAFVYGKPDYEDPAKIIGSIAGNYEKVYKEDGNKVVSGYSDEQIGYMYDDAYLHKSKDRLLLGLDRYAQDKGYGPMTDPDERRKIGKEYIRMMLPWKTDIKEQSSSGAGPDSSPYNTRTAYDTKVGDLNVNDVKNHVRKNADGSLAIDRVGFGSGQEPYSFATSGKYKVYGADYYDNNSKMFNAKLVTTRHQFANDIAQKIVGLARGLKTKDANGRDIEGITGEIFEGEETVKGDNRTEQQISQGRMTPEQFHSLGLQMGFGTDEIVAIQEKFTSGGYANPMTADLKRGDMLLDNTGRNGLSANAFLLHVMDQKATQVGDNEQWTPDFEQEMSTLYKNKGKSDYIYINGAKIDSHIDLMSGSDINNANGTAKKAARDEFNSRMMNTNTVAWDVIGEGYVAATSDSGKYQGFTDTNNWVGGGRNGLMEVMENPNLTKAAALYYKQKSDYVDAYAAKDSKNAPLLINEFFKGLDKTAIGAHLNFKGTNGLSAIQYYDKIIAEEKEFLKANPLKKFRENLSPQEKMILSLCEQYAKLP